MGPAGYLSDEEFCRLRSDVGIHGFEPDGFLIRDPDVAVLGLNLAIAWPLPPILRESYQKLVAALGPFDSALSVYLYENTHITVATLMNFKKHQNPSSDEVHGAETMAQKVAERIAEEQARLPGPFRPFDITFGPPLLSRNAVFLPILNPTGEISRIRQITSQSFRGLVGDELSIPKAIHCTVARFRRTPDVQPVRFFEEFHRRMGELRLGTATIDALLLTAETKPYMRSGRVLHRFPLLGERHE